MTNLPVYTFRRRLQVRLLHKLVEAYAAINNCPETELYRISLRDSFVAERRIVLTFTPFPSFPNLSQSILSLLFQFYNHTFFKKSMCNSSSHKTLFLPQMVSVPGVGISRRDQSSGSPAPGVDVCEIPFQPSNPRLQAVPSAVDANFNELNFSIPVLELFKF